VEYVEKKTKVGVNAKEGKGEGGIGSEKSPSWKKKKNRRKTKNNGSEGGKGNRRS